MIVLRIFRPLQLMTMLLGAAVLVSTVSAATAASLSASLNTDEHQFAASVAERQRWLQNPSATQQSATQGSSANISSVQRSSAQRSTEVLNDLPSGAHLLDIQTLSIELDEVKKNKNQRRARVYQFNYNTQQSRLILVDLDTRDVVKTQPIASIHLPLNEHEIATARALVEQQPALMNEMNQEQQSRGLPDLADLSDIDVKASIFEPSDHTHVCAKQRCALISLFDHTRTVFALEPLVNLQTLSVTTLQKSF